MICLFVSANSAIQGRDCEHRTGLVGGSDACSNGASTDTCDFEGAASMWRAFAPHLQEDGGLSRPSSTKHRGRPRRSRRSAARIAARHTQRSRGATEVFGGIPVPDQATTATSVAA